MSRVFQLLVFVAILLAPWAASIASRPVVPPVNGDSAGGDETGGDERAGTTGEGGPGPLYEELLEAITLSLAVPPSKEFYVKYDASTGTLQARQLPNEAAGLPQEALDAIARAPRWLRLNLTMAFGRLADADIDVGSYATPELSDLNGDGLSDVTVGTSGGSLDHYENVDGGLHYYEGYDYALASLYVRDAGLVTGASVSGFSDPATGDLDGDNDVDLLLGAQDGIVYVFENVGTVSSPTFSSTGFVAGLTVGTASAPDLADLDADGDYDLVVGAGDGRVYYKENTGPNPQYVSDGDPGTVTYADWSTPAVVLQAGGFDIDAGDSSNPALFDLDDDGDPDLILGASDGTLRFHRNQGTPTSWGAGEPAVFQGIDVGTFSAPLVADLDGDYDGDLVIGAQDGTLHYYENKGTAAAPQWIVWTRTPTQFAIFNPNTYYVDDSQVRLRHRASSALLLQYADIINTVPQKMVDEVAFTIAYSSVQTLRNSYMKPEMYRNNTEALYFNDQFIDYANILEFDLGGEDQWSTVEYWVLENGSRVRYEYPKWVYYWFLVHPKITDELPTLIDPTVFASGHADDDTGDNVIDVDATVSDGIPPGPSFWRWLAFNENETDYPSSSTSGEFYFEGHSAPAFADIDDDGDRDLFVGELYGVVKFYRNLGTPAVPSWAPYVELSDAGGATIDVGDYSHPVLADLDGDLDADLLVGSQNGPLFYWENTGVLTAPAWTDDSGLFASVEAGMWSAPDLADLDGDGDLDLLAGMTDGRVLYWRNDGPNPSYVSDADPSTVTLPVWTPQGPLTLAGEDVDVGSRSSPATFDYDGDGDLDLVVGNRRGNLTLYENLGGPLMLFLGSAAEVVDGGGAPVMAWNTLDFNNNPMAAKSIPTFADLDGDGDADLTLGQAPGNLTYYRNLGNPASPSWSGVVGFYSSSAKPKGSPPLLRDALAGIDVLWNSSYPAGSPSEVGFSYWTHGLGRAMNWVQQTCPLRPEEDDDGNRPRQPARIQWENNCRSGELEDLTLASMRASLIAAYGVDGYGGDHEWENFWHNGWWQADNWYSWSSSRIGENEIHTRWNRDWSGLIIYRGDTRTLSSINATHSIEDHTGEGGADRANVTVTVRDASGNPVDGAKVAIGDYRWIWVDTICDSVPVFCWFIIGTQSFFTNQDGVAYFTTSETRQRSMGDNTFDDGIHIWVDSKFGGGSIVDNPSYSNRIILNVPGVNNQSLYEYVYQVPGPVPTAQPAVSSGPALPSGRYLLNVTLSVTASYQHPASGWCYDDCRIDEGRNDRERGTYHNEEMVERGHLDAFVLDAGNMEAFLKGYPFVGYNISLNTGDAALTFEVPLPEQDWYVVFSNRDSMETFIELDASVELIDAQSPNLTFQRAFDAGMLGMNLVSFPVVPADLSVEAVLASLAGKYDGVWQYNATRGAWLSYSPDKATNSLAELDQGMGFWIYITQPGTLTVTGPPPVSTDIPLGAGWNLVGFPSQSSSYAVADLKAATGATRVEGFDSAAGPYYLRELPDSYVMKAGEGYWVYAPVSTVWTVPG
jgi:hypothetical protein